MFLPCSLQPSHIHFLVLSAWCSSHRISTRFALSPPPTSQGSLLQTKAVYFHCTVFSRISVTKDNNKRSYKLAFLKKLRPKGRILADVQSPRLFDSLRPHGLQHARLPCHSLSPRVCSNSDPLNRPECFQTGFEDQ